MFYTTNISKTFSYYGDALYQSLPNATDLGATIRQTLPKDPTSLVLIAAGVALYGLSRFLAAPSKQQEEEVLDLERMPAQVEKPTFGRRIIILQPSSVQDLVFLRLAFELLNDQFPCTERPVNFQFQQLIS